MAEVFVSAGSNVDKENNIPSCVAALRGRFGAVRTSSVYRSPAVGFEGDDFFNMVVSFETAAPPEDVARILRLIEKAHGRTRGKDSFAPRRLDLDQLLYGDLVCERDGLCLPRKEITEHAFVIVPLAELNGDAKHPVLGISYNEVKDGFGDVSGLSRVELDLGC